MTISRAFARVTATLNLCNDEITQHIKKTRKISPPQKNPANEFELPVNISLRRGRPNQAPHYFAEKLANNRTPPLPAAIVTSHKLKKYLSQMNHSCWSKSLGGREGLLKETVSFQQYRCKGVLSTVWQSGRACMLSIHGPLPFIRLPQSGGLSKSSWH